MKVKINDTEFESPFHVSGESMDVAWFAKRLLQVAEHGGGFSVVNVQTDDDYARHEQEAQRKHEEHILTAAAEIRARRAASD